MVVHSVVKNGREEPVECPAFPLLPSAQEPYPMQESSFSAVDLVACSIANEVKADFGPSEEAFAAAASIRGV